MANSTITKRALSQALKELCKEKQLEKISISDITDYCGLIRQSFYYHFDDKKALLQWIYETELFQRDKGKLTTENYAKRFENFINNIEVNRVFYQQTITSYDSFFSDYMYSILYEFFYGISEQNAAESGEDDKQRKIFAGFFASGFVGVVISWVKNSRIYSAQDMIYYLNGFIKSYYSMAKVHKNEIAQ